MLFFSYRNTLILEEVKGILQIPSFLSLWIESWPFYCRDCTLFLQDSHDMWHHYTSMSTVPFPTSWVHGVSMKPSNMSAFQPRLELVFQLITFNVRYWQKVRVVWVYQKNDVGSTGKLEDVCKKGGWLWRSVNGAATLVDRLQGTAKWIF
jgi:hypothetical protein